MADDSASLELKPRRSAPFRLSLPFIEVAGYNESETTGGRGEMAIDPAEITLNESQRKRLAEMAERTGRPWSELLNEALRKMAREDEESGIRLRKILDSGTGAGALHARPGHPG